MGLLYVIINKQGAVLKITRFYTTNYPFLWTAQSV